MLSYTYEFDSNSKHPESQVFFRLSGKAKVEIENKSVVVKEVLL